MNRRLKAAELVNQGTKFLANGNIKKLDTPVLSDLGLTETLQALIAAWAG